MTAAPARCAECQTPLPGDAQFCPRCGTRTPTQISGGGTTAVVPPTTPDALTAQRERLQRALGPDYVVEELLGSGGFAQVWAAQDRKLHRRVAVKVLHPELVASRSLIERFQREAQSVAKLRHPGIVPIYGVGEVEGTAYYVMPLVEGQSLREHLRGGALPVVEARRILRDAAAAIAVAHRAGIVHRDVKPENVMLDGEERRVLVMDFGIAKSTEAGATGLTGTGMIIGTPAYMSPEQASASKEIDARSDVYSLGVLGFEMLTGRTPFEAESAQDLMFKQLTTPAPSLAAVRPDVPEDLVIAVNRCLAKAPVERWAHAGELAAFLEQQATPTGQPTPVSRDLKRFARRRWRPTRAQVRIGVAVALAAGLATTWFTRRDLFYLALDYWLPHGREQPASEDPDAMSSVELGDRARGQVQRPWIGQVFNVGQDALAAFDATNLFEGLHLFDGTSWKSFRSPEPIRSAAQADGAVLLFGDSSMYRWTADGVRREATTPFPVTLAWARGRDLLVVSERGELAWRTADGWRRQPSPRRVRLANVFGPSRDSLFVLGYFAGGSTADSIVEYTGVAWESVDPRPDKKVQWVYDAGTTLPDGTTLVGGRAETAPLLLVHDPARGWSRRDLHAPPGLVFDIWGIWGRTGDSLLVWNPSCTRHCLAEITLAGMAPVAALDRGAILGVAALRGIPHVLRGDGTVWARRAGQWAHAAEVPHLSVRAVAGLGGEGRYRASAWVGDGLVRGGFGGDPSLGDRTLLVPSLPVSRFRGVAVGHHEAWLLGDDGRVYHADCRFTSPCATEAARLGDSVVALTQQTGGGAIAVGARGLVARTGLRVWQSLSLPRGAERESLVAVAARADTGFVVLGRRHVFSFRRSGDSRTLAELPPSLRTATLVAALPHGGAALATPLGKFALSDSAGALRFVEPILQNSEIVTALLSLEDGRVVAAISERADDPYATGRAMVVRSDTTDRRTPVVTIPLNEGPRTGLYSLRVFDAWLEARGIGGILARWRLDALPLRPTAGGH